LLCGKLERLTHFLVHVGFHLRPVVPASLYGIEFYNTERSVRTASSEQVRRPISGEGLFQWRNYEPWLGSLEDALGDALIRYRHWQDAPQPGLAFTSERRSAVPRPSTALLTGH
jgi:hypothetical protein